MVKTVRPHTYDDVIYIGHYFREGEAVVMDLTALANPDAQAFVDFAAGLVVGCGGGMERVAPKVFLLRPVGGGRDESARRPATSSSDLA